MPKKKVKITISKPAPAPEPAQQALPGVAVEEGPYSGNFPFDDQNETIEADIAALDMIREQRMANQKQETICQDRLIVDLEAAGLESYHRGKFAAWTVVEGKLKKKVKVRVHKQE